VKKKSYFQCQECGYEVHKWMGKCSECEGWNTFQEMYGEKKTADKGSLRQPGIVMPYQDIVPLEGERIETGFSELDRVLGGGLVKGSVVLIGGSPGIGKSTILLQVAGKLGNRCRVLYVTGEESVQQVKMRGKRLGIQGENLFVAAETNFEEIKSQLDHIQPAVMILDSIQTLYRPGLSSPPGTVTQIREVTAEVVETAKKKDISVFMVGHVTKEGVMAGPRLLEHMVDCVLYFEGESQQSYLLLRGVKNRFGSTHELGVFQMQERGLAQIENPSEIFLSCRQENTVGSAVTASLEGTRPLLIEIQALVTPTRYENPRRMTQGLDYNRVVLLMAVLEKKLGFYLHGHDVFLKVAGGVKLTEPTVDLGVAVSLFSSFKNCPVHSRDVFIGEVGLTGEVRAVKSLEKRILEGKKLGFQRFIVPSTSINSLNGLLAEEVKGVKTLKEALAIAFSSVS